MTKPKITAHTLVKNEQRWIWFALMSVIDYVDEILVWDTGSTDDTVKIINSINSPKIKFKQVGQVDPVGHTTVREEMLEATDSDWILILDGDEIWWHSSLVSCIDASMHPSPPAAIISPFINLVGDIFHFQDSKSSNYKIGSHHGAFNLRFINRKIPGLHVGNPHGRQEYRDSSETALQNFPSDKLLYINAPFLHTTHLPRSVSRKIDNQTLKRDFKYRYELGLCFGADFVYPEALYLPYPNLVPDPFFHRSVEYVCKSLAVTPARKIKQLLFNKKIQGY
jgi:glycosyltransferase involved in cell wall biosynthesis